MMTDLSAIFCDGCGQPASSEHIARRLQRLEWSTRYRPIHLHTLLLGAISPLKDAEFLYSPGSLSGEAAKFLEAAAIESDGKTTDAVHAEFQRRGMFLVYLLECPLEGGAANGASNAGESQLRGPLLASRLAPLFTKIRRSLKPKRMALVSEVLTPLLPDFQSAGLGCELLSDGGKAFALDSSHDETAKQALQNLRAMLGTLQRG